MPACGARPAQAVGSGALDGGPPPLFATTSSTGTAATPITVVRNVLGLLGDFEYPGQTCTLPPSSPLSCAPDGVGEGWQITSNAPSVTPSLDATVSYTGQHSQRFDLTYGGSYFRAAVPFGVGGPAQVQTGNTLTISFEALTSATFAGATANVYLYCYTSTGAACSTFPTTRVAAIASPLSSWTAFSLTTPALPAEAASLAVSIEINNGTCGEGTVWLDDMVISNGLTAQVPAPRKRSYTSFLYEAYDPPIAVDWYTVASDVDLVILGEKSLPLIHTLKYYNPSAKVLTYGDGSYIINNPSGWGPGFVVDFNWALANDPSWLLTRGTDAGTPEYIQGFNSREYLADVGSSSYSSLWTENVQAMYGAWATDGTFIDDVEGIPYSAYPSRYPTASDWQSAMAGFVSRVYPSLRSWIAGSFPTIVGNFGKSGNWSAAPWPSYLANLDGALEEQCFYEENTPTPQYVGQAVWQTQIESPAANPTKHYLAQSQTSLSAYPTEGEFSFASYLLMESSYSMFAVVDAGNTFQWSPGFEVAIGSPSGAMTAVSGCAHTYQRSFTGGLVMANGDDSASCHTWLANTGIAYNGTSFVKYLAGPATLPPQTGLVLIY